ncbi:MULTISPECIES: hypothetical protein [Streptomyces]|uniref:hypothetical protein n=1 Tax=Streptomyces TaxID=1883 RepID=UPI00287FB707|nr:hypothetical protein [Streptomyces sp. CGMCC 4.1456]WNF67240.1 hypothetical protein RJD14_33830 [Streptomyces sp. CGMCC 4.1456]
MVVTPDTLTRLAKLSDLRIEEIGAPPQTPGQPHTFRVTPTSLFLVNLPGGEVPLPPPLPAPVPVENLLPVDITVTWHASDQEHNQLGTDEFFIQSTPAPTEVQSLLQVAFLFAPKLVEALAGVSLTFTTRHIRADATLTFTPREGGSPVVARVPLLSHPVSVPDLQIPTLAAFFAKDDFGADESDPSSLSSGDQFMLVVVPKNSPIGGISPLRDALEKLHGISSALQGLSDAAGDAVGVAAMLPGIGALVDAINRHIPGADVGVVSTSADFIRNLNDITTIQHGLFTNDIEAEDTISSMIFFSKPRERGIRCYQNSRFRGSSFVVTAGDACYTLVSKLSDPVAHSKPAGLVKKKGDLSNFDNRLSSIAFSR